MRTGALRGVVLGQASTSGYTERGHVEQYDDPPMVTRRSADLQTLAALVGEDVAVRSTSMRARLTAEGASVGGALPPRPGARAGGRGRPDKM